MAEEKTNPKSKSNSRNKGRRNYRKNNSGKSNTREAKTENASTPTNRPAMDRAIENILINSSTIAPRTIAGNIVQYPFDTFHSSLLPNLQTVNKYVIPGVYSVEFIPTVGYADGKQTNPVNLAARNVWMNLRSLYSNRIPYTAGAIMQYALALDSVLCAFQWLKRAYGIAFAYDARNKYVADGILKAMGFDGPDFRANLPDVKVYINRMSTMLTAFGIPVEFRFALSHMDLCSHVYVDDTTPNAQYIITTPAYLYKMDWTNNRLVPKRWSNASSQGTWSGIASDVTELVEAFVNNEDVYMIASDMLRLYGQLASVGPVDDGFAIGPEFSPEFLEEIHNATFIGDPAGWSTVANADIAFFTLTEEQAVENVGALSANYCTTNFNVINPGYIVPALTPGLYDFETSEPSIEQIVRASDWKVVFGNPTVAPTANKWPVHIVSCGTKIFASCKKISMQITDGAVTGYQVTNILPGYMTTFIEAGTGGWASPSKEALDMCQWKQHPIIPHIEYTIGKASNVWSVTLDSIQAPFGELSQYFEIDTNDIKRIHEAIVLDAFDAAGVGTLNLKAK